MRQKHLWLAFAAATVLLLSATTSYAQTVAYDAIVQPGNQAWTGNLGLDFDVNTGKTIIVTSLGAFDNNGDGFTGTVNVAIYNRDTQAQVCGPLAISGTGDTLTNGDRFVALGAPCVLPAGHYSVVAVGFNATDLNGNVTIASPPVTPSTENSGGAISFVGNGRYDSSTSLDFPPDCGGSPCSPAFPSNVFLAGTFVFQAAATPLFTKTFVTPGGVSSLNIGDTVPVVFQVVNLDPVGLTGISFTDTLPGGLLVGTPAVISNTCHGAVTAVPASNSISLTGGTVNGNGVCDLVVNVTGVIGGLQTNTTSPLTSNLGTAVLTSPPATASIFVYAWWLWFFYA